MRLKNTTIAILAKNAQGGLQVVKTVQNPLVPTKNGKPVLGPCIRLLKTVKQVLADNPGWSKNKAQQDLRVNPHAHLAS